MRKVFLVLASVFALNASNAQTSFGIHAEGISASQTYKINGISFSPSSRFSWKAGLVANAPLSEQISFMPQLNLVSKGSKFDVQGEKSTTKLTYLELPLNLVYNSDGFFAGLGPVLSYGIGGKITDDVESVDVKFDGKKEAEVTDDNAHLKAFEFGGNIIAGYKLQSGLFFNVHYNIGFSNISPDTEGTAKNKYLGFGIGYFFGGSSK